MEESILFSSLLIILQFINFLFLIAAIRVCVIKKRLHVQKIGNAQVELADIQIVNKTKFVYWGMIQKLLKSIGSSASSFLQSKLLNEDYFLLEFITFTVIASCIIGLVIFMYFT